MVNFVFQVDSHSSVSLAENYRGTILKISKKAIERIAANLKTYQAVAQMHKAKDVSEADTVTLIKDILSYCFGFDKYAELTSEQQIRGTYCDLAIKIDGKIKCLIEVKAAGVDLNDSHLRQALNYGANQGIEWIVLTNSIDWRLHRIKFGQPIDHEEVSTFNFLTLNMKSEEDQKKAFLMCREGIDIGAMSAYHQHAQILNRFTVAQVLLTDALIGSVRKELRKLFPDVKIDTEQISEILKNEVLKRDAIDGEKAKETQQKIKRILTKMAKQAEKSALTKTADSPSKDEGSSIEASTTD